MKETENPDNSDSMDGTNLVNKFGKSIAVSGLGSYEFGCALGLYSLSSIIKRNITISYGDHEFFPSIRLFALNDYVSDYKMNYLLGFCYSTINGYKKIDIKQKWNTTLGTVKNNKMDTSIIVPDFVNHYRDKIKNPKNDIDLREYSMDLCLNYINSICCIPSGSLNDILHRCTDGLGYLLYRSFCINVAGDNSNDLKFIPMKTYNYLKLRIIKLKNVLNEITAEKPIKFVFNRKIQRNINSWINVIHQSFLNGEYKHNSSINEHLYFLPAKISTAAILFYIGRKSFLKKIKDIKEEMDDKQREFIQINIPSDIVRLTLNFFENYFMKRTDSLSTTERFILWIPENVKSDRGKFPGYRRISSEKVNQND